MTIGVGALLLGIGIGAAGQTDKDERVASGQPAATATTERPATAGTTRGPTSLTTIPSLTIGQTATFRLDNAKITVHQFVDSGLSGDRFSRLKAGNHWAALDIELCAGTNELSVNPLYVELVMPDNSRLERDGADIRTPELKLADLPAGECIRGWLSYQVPDGQRPTFILWDGARHYGKWTVPPA